MECSICMEAIQGNTNISTTECGHSFHHQCLYKWNRRHTNCPLCRKEFGDVEQEGGYGRQNVVQLLGNMDVAQYVERVVTIMASPRAGIQQIARRHYEQVPIEEFTGEIEERDIQLVAQQAEVSHETAHRYLRYYGGDIVNAIMYLTEYKEDMLIPPFRRRDRGASEPYEHRTVRDRLVSSRRDDGYESC